jgi:hypothetical protein
MLVPRTYDRALFQPNRLADTLPVNPLTPVEPPAKDAKSGAMSSGNQGRNDRKANGHKRKDWRVQVLEVGVDTITAPPAPRTARSSRWSWTQTRYFKLAMAASGIVGARSAVAPGALLEVAVRKDNKRRTPVAERVALCDNPQQ